MLCPLSLAFLLHWPLICGYRILFVPAHNAISHAKSMYIAGEALKRAGHDVSVLQLLADADPNQRAKNEVGLTDRVIRAVPGVSDLDTVKIATDITWSSRQSQPDVILAAWAYTTVACVSMLSNEPTREQLSAIWNEHWDAVVLDDLTACGLVAVQNGLTNKSAVIVDFKLVLRHSLQRHEAVIPVWTNDLGAYEYGTFLYRLGTTIHGLQCDLTMKYIDYMVSSLHDGLRTFESSILDEKRTMAINALPYGLDVTFPQALDTGEYDTDCSTEAQLPENIRTFIEDPSSRGTILFTMGHYANWNSAPTGAIDSFIGAFSQLRQYRIVWQISNELKNLTSNVLVGKWIPQRAILNHAKTKLFISHMGIKSMREAICARVPVLAFPMFADQYRNTIIARYRGFGVYLEKTKLSPQYVYRSIKRVLDDPSYYTAVRRLQDQLSDKIRNASSLFAHKVDFFIRRNEERIMTKYIRRKWKVPLNWVGEPIAMALFISFILYMVIL